ncbi:hypothetical protein EV129_113112 [Rhizobium azibense]|uniref:Uncharacterized protein n=1 Tax=Rhizobium azibense TaxID=1136135 RepID=A0A4R3RF02_9HYPH|nr:hypothetical protein EV129_113112 [Rhizobium azibense]
MLPDLTAFFYFAIFGMICGALVILIGAPWAGYHLFMALCQYAEFCAR